MFALLVTLFALVTNGIIAGHAPTAYGISGGSATGIAASLPQSRKAYGISGGSATGITALLPNRCKPNTYVVAS